jgi:drug/metabolite transporter (DMT)-like permease
MINPASSSRIAVSSTFLLAAGLTIFSNFFFTASHGIVRHIGPELHPFEITFFSNLFSALFYVPWFLKVGLSPLKTTKFKFHFIRAFFNVAALIAWYTALSLVPLADAVALGLAGPLFVTVGAMLFLGEKIKMRRWIALGIGICGALVIIRPGFETLSIGFLFVILSGACGAGTKLFAKHLSETDSAVTCSAYVAILQTPISFCFALFVWKTPSLEQLGWLAATGVFVALAHLCMVQAFKYVEVSALEPFVFTRLIWAALIGFFIFSEFPGAWTWVGAAIIVSASTYIAHRESRRV